MLHFPVPLFDAPRISVTPLRVLVVEDTATDRKMMKRCLELLGCECDEAANGQEAIKSWSRLQSAYHLIFMDNVQFYSFELFVLATQN